MGTESQESAGPRNVWFGKIIFLSSPPIGAYPDHKSFPPFEAGAGGPDKCLGCHIIVLQPILLVIGGIEKRYTLFPQCSLLLAWRDENEVYSRLIPRRR